MNDLPTTIKHNKVSQGIALVAALQYARDTAKASGYKPSDTVLESIDTALDSAKSDLETARKE